MATSPLKVKYRTNPFIHEDGSGLVVFKNKSETLETAGPLQVTDSHTGEMMSVAQVKKTVVVDGDRFVKLFVKHLDAFFDLKPGTVRLLMALIEELSQARYAHGDTIYLNYSKVTNFFTSKGLSRRRKQLSSALWLSSQRRSSLLHQPT